MGRIPAAACKRCAYGVKALRPKGPATRKVPRHWVHHRRRRTPIPRWSAARRRQAPARVSASCRDPSRPGYRPANDHSAYSLPRASLQRAAWPQSAHHTPEPSLGGLQLPRALRRSLALRPNQRLRFRFFYCWQTSRTDRLAQGIRQYPGLCTNYRQRITLHQ